MPNISDSFGSSLNGGSTSLLKPVPSFKNTEPSKDEVVDESKAGTSKQTEEETNLSSIGLYEELLASSTGMKLSLSYLLLLAYGLDWNEQDDASMLAQVIALSQQEFLDNLKKSPR